MVRYDPKTATKEQILDTIDRLGFPGKIMADSAGAKSP